MEDLKDCLMSKFSKLIGDEAGLPVLTLILSLLEYRTWGCVDFSINSIEMLLSSARRRMTVVDRETFDSLIQEVKQCFKDSRCEGIDHSVCIQDIRDVIKLTSMNLSNVEMRSIMRSSVEDGVIKFLTSGRKEEGDIASAFEVLKEDYEINNELVERIVNDLPVIVVRPEFTLEHSTNNDRVVHFVMPKQLLQAFSSGAHGNEVGLEESISFLLARIGFSVTSKEVEIPGEGKVKIDLVGEKNSARVKNRIWVFTSPKDRECVVDDLRNVLNSVVITREIPNMVFMVCRGGDEKVLSLAHEIGVHIISRENAEKEMFYSFLDSLPIFRDIFEKMSDVSDLISMYKLK